MDDGLGQKFLEVHSKNDVNGKSDVQFYPGKEEEKTVFKKIKAVSCETMLGPGKHRSGCYWMDHRAPNGGARESTQVAKGVCNPISGTTI